MAEKKQKKSQEELLKKAKRWFKLATETSSKQRVREKEDLEFQVPELQWDEQARNERTGGTIGNQTVPPRPMLSVSLLNQPMQLIKNQALQAHLGVEIHPVSEKAKKEIADTLQGLYRRIERDSNAALARLWALDRAIQCGRGWYRINTQYDEDSDNTGDQEIVIERLLHQDAVHVDPAAEAPDFSDARYIICTSWVPLEAFKEEFPKADVPVNDQEFKAWEKEDPEWVKMDGEDRAVLVAECFYKEYVKIDVVTGGQRRDQRIKYAKLTGRQVLEEADWAGRHIPLVPVFGRELQPFDAERRWEGVVRQARDGQRYFNFAISTHVEAMAEEPKNPYIGAEGQFEGHEEEFQLAARRVMPFIEYKPTTIEGQPAPPPERQQVDTSRMVLATQAVEMGKQLVQVGTSIYDPSLGRSPDETTAQSGRAILALQQQADAGTGHFLQTLAKISMMYEAKVILDLMPKIYDRPGRITQILGPNDEQKTVMVNAPFVPGPGGVPQPPPPAPVPGLAAPEEEPPEPKEYNLSEGRYSISVSVGKSFQTRLQEGQAEIGDVIAKAPMLMNLIGDLWFKFRDFPGAKEIGERLERFIKSQAPGIIDDEEEGVTLQQAMAKIAEMGQMLEAQGQQMELMSRDLEIDKAKQEATLIKTQQDNTSREAIAKLDNLTKLLMKQLDVESKTSEGDEEREHEAREGDADRDNEEMIAKLKAETDLEKARRQSQTAVFTSQQRGGKVD
jgi:hypothetical protein